MRSLVNCSASTSRVPSRFGKNAATRAIRPTSKRQTCAPLVREHWRPVRRSTQSLPSNGERVEVRDVPPTRSRQRLNRASSTARQNGAGNDGQLSYAADEPASTPAGPVLPERIGDGLNPLKVR
jgi:hypothetical protein